jgi:hypothetical protein
VSWFSKKRSVDDRLLGRWSIDQTDTAAVDALGDAVMEFDDRGNLIYIVKTDDTDQVMLMTYRVSGDEIITDQPSAPNPQKSGYAIDGDALTLVFDGHPARFKRP